MPRFIVTCIETYVAQYDITARTAKEAEKLTEAGAAKRLLLERKEQNIDDVYELTP